MLSGVLITAIGGMRGYYLSLYRRLCCGNYCNVRSGCPFKMRSQVYYRRVSGWFTQRPLYITFLGISAEGCVTVSLVYPNVLLYQLIRNEALIAQHPAFRRGGNHSFAIITLWSL
jgi:hypothetical protein